MINWREIDSRFCLSCFYAALISLAISASGDWLMALFVFASTAVLIAGWKSSNETLFLIGLCIFVGWVINTLVYFSLQRIQVIDLGFINILPITLVYFTAATVHFAIAIIAFNHNHGWIAALGTIMGTVALAGLITRDPMPWRAVGNVAFLLQCCFFVGVCLLVLRSKRIKPQTTNGQVLKFEASHGRNVAGVR